MAQLRIRVRKELLTPVNFLTVLVIVAWVMSFAIRTVHPDFTGSSAVDAGLLLVLGYWFSSNAVRRTRQQQQEESGS